MWDLVTTVFIGDPHKGMVEEIEVLKFGECFERERERERETS